MNRWLVIAAPLALGGLLVSACVPGLTGAPCNTNDNCPSGQACVDGTCQLGSGGSGGSGGAGGNGGGTGGSGGNGGGGGGSACGDTQSSVSNCGTCGNVCPTPVQSTAACTAGVCGRGPCSAGRFDLDGPVIFGCESTCVGRSCTLGDGGTITASNDPIAETGLVGRSVVNGSSVGAGVQTNTNHSNLGSIGEATPRVGGGIETSNSTHKHRGGFGARVK